MKSALVVLFAAAFAAVGWSRAADEGRGIPYNSVNRTMSLLKSRKIGGKDCVPFYLRSRDEKEPLDPAKARFRVRTWEGDELSLKVEPLGSVPAGNRTELEKKMIEDGYTHRIWIPKGEKTFLDGSIVHSMPKGSVEMTQGFVLAGKAGDT